MARCSADLQVRRAGRPKGLHYIFLVSLSLVTAQAQQAPPVFRSGARLIVQTVSVKDKDGRVIEGLTANDFVVTEDGEPQTVSFVEFQRLPDRPAEARAAVPGAARTRRRQRTVRDAGTDSHSSSRRRAVPGSAAPRALLRSHRDAACRSDAGVHGRPDVHRYADATVGSAGDHDVRRRRGTREAGFHRRSRRAARGHADADLRGRQGRRRHPRQHRYRHRVRPGRRGVQHPEHRSSAVGASNGGDDAARAAGAEGAGLFRQRAPSQRRRQSGAAARDDERRHSRQRGIAPHRRARPDSPGAARRRDEAVARRHRHVQRSAGAERADVVSAIAGHAVLASPRTRAVMRCSTTTTSRWASRRRRSR